MKRACGRILFLMILFCCYVSVLAAEKTDNQNIKTKKSEIAAQKYTPKQDMAFISIYGSRPDAKALQGFQRAVLFNAQGVVIKKVEIGSDSVYSLDKMIQENKSRGPLFIRMYR